MPNNVTMKGPLFDGTYKRVLDDFETDCERTVAAQAEHPTGRYQRAIGVRDRGHGEVVTDGGVIYGPWLEGTGSRNARSRFKGYAAFRKATQRLAREAEETAQKMLDGTYLGRLR